MIFIRAEAREGAVALAKCLKSALTSDKKVLWLLTGGSSITASVEAMNLLPDELTRNLTITLGDERYGPVGHKDSNMQQVLDAGFAAKQATIVPVLIDQGLDETATQFARVLQQAFDDGWTVIAQFGIGTDGHISGILPHSPAVSANGLVATYQGPDHIRITTTFEAIRQFDVVYAMAYGESKRQALENLLNRNLSLDEQPAQIFKSMKKVYIYNDQIEEK